MILLWIVLGAMTLAAAVILAWPLFDSRRFKNDSSFALAVYRDQLAEINHDAARGILDEAQARAAQIEIERRILSLDDAPKFRPARAPTPLLIVAMAVVLPLAGFGLYLRLGSPGLPGEPAGMGASIVTPDSQGSQGWTATDGAAPTAPDIAAAAQMSDSDRQAMIAVMVAKLADRLKVQPEDLEGWTRLARAYDVLGRSDESRKAWSQVARLAPTRLDAQLGYASSMIAGAADSSLGLSPDFVATVTRIRALAPENPLGLYFGGMVARASGDNAAAREMWIRVLALIPPGVASRTSLQREIDSLPP